jgi:hypothetical protein
MAQKPLLRVETWIEVGAHAVRNRRLTGQSAVGWCGQAGVSRGTWVCVCCLVFVAPCVVWRRQLPLCGVPSQGIVYKAPAPLISEWGVRGTSPSVCFELWIVCWCVRSGVGIGGKDGPVLFDLGGAACCCQALTFWCRSGVAPGLPQNRLSDSKWGFGREAVPLCAVLRDVGPLREGQWKTKVLKISG